MSLTDGRAIVKKTIPAGNANRRFPEFWRTVKGGNSVVATRPSKPVAKIIHAGPNERTADRAQSAIPEAMQEART